MTRRSHTIAVMDADGDRCRDLCRWLADHHYDCAPVQTPEQLRQCLQLNDCRAAIIDIDSTGLTDKAVRKIVRLQPDMQFLLLSSRHYHPELRDALTFDVHACLSRPYDPEELLYWLENISTHHPGASLKIDQAGHI